MLAGVVALVLAAACDVTEDPEPTATPSAIAPFALTNPEGLVAHADPTASIGQQVVLRTRVCSVATTANDLVLCAWVDFDPQTVVVPLGFDTHREDPIAILGLRSEDLGRWAERVARLGRAQLHVLEGGYALNRLGESAVAYVQRLGSA